MGISNKPKVDTAQWKADLKSCRTDERYAVDPDKPMDDPDNQAALEAQENCRQYVDSCYLQAANGDEFVLVPENGPSLTVDSLQKCVKQIPYYVDTYGKMAQSVQKDPIPKEKVEGIHLAGDEAFKKLALSADQYKIYYLDSDEDLVLVDRIDVKDQKGFSLSNTGDQIRRLSKGETGAPVAADAPEVQKLLSSWRLPAIDNLDIDKLIAYLKDRPLKINEIKELSKNINNSVKIGEAIHALIELARAIYPPEVSKANMNVISDSIDGQYFQDIISDLGDSAPDVLGYLAMYFADKGEFEKMDEAYNALVKINPSADIDSIEMMREIGYKNAVKMMLGTLEAETMQSEHALTKGIARLEMAVEGKTIGKDAQLFDDATVYFSEGIKDVNGTEVTERIDNLKIKLCETRARKILADFKDKHPKAKEIDTDTIDKIMQLPAEVGVTNTDKAKQVLKTFITNIAQEVARGRVLQLIDAAEAEIKKEPPIGLGRIEFVTNPTWLTGIDDFLDEAAKIAVAGGIEIGDSIYTTIENTRMKAYAEVMNSFIAQIDVVANAERKENGWYDTVSNLIDKAKAVLEKSRLTETKNKDELQAMFDKSVLNARKAKIWEYFNLASKNKDLSETLPLEKDKYIKYALDNLQEADKMYTQYNIEDSDLRGKIDALRSGMQSNGISEELVAVKKMADNKVIFDFESVAGNTQLAAIDKKIDEILQSASSSKNLTNALKNELESIRRDAYKKFVVYHYEKAVEAFSMRPTTAISLESKWIGDMFTQLNRAGAYLIAKHDGVVVLETEYVTDFNNKIEKQKKAGLEAEADSLRAKANEFMGSSKSLGGADWFVNMNKYFDRAKQRFAEAGRNDDIVKQIEGERRQGYAMRIELLTVEARKAKRNSDAGCDTVFNDNVKEIERLIHDKIPNSNESIFSGADQVRYENELKTFKREFSAE